jgi:CheY-like chemotaxis protein
MGELEMPKRIRVLAMSANRELLLLRARVLEANGCSVTASEDRMTALDVLAKDHFDALMICHSISDKSAQEFTGLFRQRNRAGCIIYVSERPFQQGKAFADVTICGIDGPDALISAARSCTTSQHRTG